MEIICLIFFGQILLFNSEYKHIQYKQISSPTLYSIYTKSVKQIAKGINI